MKQFLGIDLGGTAIKYSLMYEDGTIVHPQSISTPKDSLDSLYRAFDAIILPIKYLISGIAMSMPGRIDPQSGFIYTGGAISSYMTNVPFKQLMEERYQLPVAIENDGKCAAHAELWKGALKDVDSGVVVIIGTGIGGGIVLQRKVWRGLHCSAGELSYILTDFHFDKDPVFWGFRNGVNALIAPYAEKKGLDFHSVNGKDFFDALHKHDADAEEIFNQYITSMRSGLLTIQSILDVEKFCIGGGISAQDILIESIQKSVSGYFETAPDYVAMIQPEISRCQFKNDANLIGALKNFIDIHG